MKKRKITIGNIAAIAACLLVISVLAILLVHLGAGIKKDRDILNQYDTYVIGNISSRSTHLEDKIDDKGNISPNNTYITEFKYEYNGKTYTLTDYQKSGDERFTLNDAEAIKLKSEKPEQAVLKRKYTSEWEWVGVIFLSFLEIFAIIFSVAVIYSIFAKEETEK